LLMMPWDVVEDSKLLLATQSINQGKRSSLNSSGINNPWTVEMMCSISKACL
ncbi:Hypothetical protein FKW44_010790, partial [Caligus rogercresseyi]